MLLHGAEAPSSHRRHRVGEIGIKQKVVSQVAEERSQRPALTLQGSCALLRRMPDDEPGNVCGSELLKVGAVWATLRKESTKSWQVRDDGPSRVAAKLCKVAPNVLHDPLVRSRRRRLLRSNHLDLAEYGEKPVQGRPIGREGVTMARTKPHLLIHNAFIDLFGDNQFPCEPTTEVADNPDVAPRTLLTVPFLQEASREQINVDAERSLSQAAHSLRLLDETCGGHLFSFARMCPERTRNYVECRNSKSRENRTPASRFCMAWRSA